MKTKELTLNAMFIAIIAVMSLVPYLGFIQIGPVAITIVHIPVIIAGAILGGKGAVIASLAFGIGSWFAAVTRAATPVDLLFTNPLVSVVPRLLFGIAVGLIFNVMSKASKNFTLNVTVTAIISTLIHTIVVLSAIFLFAVGTNNLEVIALLPSSVLTLIWVTLLANGTYEIAASVLLAVPIAIVLKRMTSR